VLAGIVVSAGAQTAHDVGVRITQDIVYRTVDGDSLLIDAFIPTAKTTKRPAILFVHGGAWRGGDKSNFTADAIRIAQIGYAAFSVNYRLTPTYAYPAPVDDVQAAVRWLRAPEQVRDYKLDPKRIGAVGASAGGHLVGMLATLGEGALTKGARIKAAVSWSGPMDFNLWNLEELAKLDLADAVLSFLDCESHPDSCPNAVPASPINHVDKTDAPMLLANAEHELVALAHATTMDAALKRAHVPEQLVVFPGDLHAQSYTADIWGRTVAFLEKYVGKPPRVKAA
jgi:acetyl esterase